MLVQRLLHRDRDNRRGEREVLALLQIHLCVNANSDTYTEGGEDRNHKKIERKRAGGEIREETKPRNGRKTCRRGGGRLREGRASDTAAALIQREGPGGGERGRGSRHGNGRRKRKRGIVGKTKGHRKQRGTSRKMGRGGEQQNKRSSRRRRREEEMWILW